MMILQYYGLYDVIYYYIIITIIEERKKLKPNEQRYV